MNNTIEKICSTLIFADLYERNHSVMLSIVSINRIQI